MWDVKAYDYLNVIQVILAHTVYKILMPLKFSKIVWSKNIHKLCQKQFVIWQCSLPLLAGSFLEIVELRIQMEPQNEAQNVAEKKLATLMWPGCSHTALPATRTPEKKRCSSNRAGRKNITASWLMLCWFSSGFLT